MPWASGRPFPINLHLLKAELVMARADVEALGKDLATEYLDLKYRDRARRAVGTLDAAIQLVEYVETLQALPGASGLALRAEKLFGKNHKNT